MDALELEDLVRRFRDQTLPKAAWTHHAHLAVGTWHVRQHDAETALSLLREGIRRLNDAHGTANTDASGYHESITRAYVALLASHLAGLAPDSDAAACAMSVLGSPLARPDILLDYYSKARLMSVEARRGWVPPDLRQW